MKRTITIIFLLQFFFFSSSYSKEFKSSHGFSFNLKDTYNHLVHINVDELELLVQNLVQNSNCIAIITDHTNIDYEWIVKHAVVVVDARNTTKLVEVHRDKIIKI